MITITHSFAEGTLIDGMVRGDGTYEILTKLGWRWFRSLDTCGIRNSRDRLAHSGLIAITVDVLRAAGYEVAEPEIDNDPRPMEDREADRAARMDDRADMLEQRAMRRAAQSDAAEAASARLGAAMQGEPIKVGHHSERRHRRDLDRVHTLDEKSWRMARQAQHAAHGAESAAAHMQHREDPHRTARRLDTLDVDQRKVTRELDGYTRNFRDGRGKICQTEVHEPATGAWRERLLERAAELNEQIRYWTEHLERAKADGTYRPVVVTDIKPGDAIRHGGGWDKVAKVNKATITVVTPPGWNNKVRIIDVTEHRPAALPEETGIEATP